MNNMKHTNNFSTIIPLESRHGQSSEILDEHNPNADNFLMKRGEKEEGDGGGVKR
jgi:hypothetical protein